MVIQAQAALQAQTVAVSRAAMTLGNQCRADANTAAAQPADEQSSRLPARAGTFAVTT
jgi:hypothetical protein